MQTFKDLPVLSLNGPSDTGMSEGEKRLLGYRLATAKIHYHMPDHPELLQTFVWQQLDLAPKFPVLRRFLNFWERQIDGRLHSVTVASSTLVTPAEMAFTQGELRLQ